MADTRPQEAVDFLHHVQEIESSNRAKALTALKFSFGDQWPLVMTQSRGDRPTLTINETDAYVRQITNELRQQRPRIKAYAANTAAQKKTADVITGLLAHFQVNSDADNAYDLGAEYAVRMGWGYWRVLTDYVREDSFDQDVFIKQIENPFSVYFDTASNEPDGSDAEKCLLTDKMRLDSFRREFPGAATTGFVATAAGDQTLDWLDKDSIRIAEMFVLDRVKAKLLGLSNGTTIWEDEIAPGLLDTLKTKGIGIKGDRMSYKRKITWRKVTAFDVLEEKPWPGRWIPVIPTYGAVMVVDGKKIRIGAVEFAMDPQRMVNYWQSAMTESIALAPKAKWLIAEGQDEGHESEFAQANISANAAIRYKQTDVEGNQAPPPQRIQPEPPPEGIVMATMAASQNLQRVMGMFDPDTNVKGPKSGRARDAEAAQAERSNYHFYDNQTRSMKHTGRICIDLVQKIMDVPRIACIIGEDGKTDLVALNGAPTEMGLAVDRVAHDVRVGDYGVIMDVGPGYNSKRKEAADILGQILAGDRELMTQIGDLYFRNLDFAGSDVIADRLAALNPLAQIDEKSEVPPGAQMMIKALQGKVDELTKTLQAAGMEIKTKEGIARIREEGATRRTLMQTTAKSNEVEQVANFKQHDTEVRAVTAQNTHEIDGIVKLLLAHVDTRNLEREIEARNLEQQRIAATEEPVAVQ